MNFAIIGASGNVGRKTIEILEKSKISFKVQPIIYTDTQGAATDSNMFKK